MSKTLSEWGEKRELSLFTLKKRLSQITACMQIPCKGGLKDLNMHFPAPGSQMPNVHVGFLGVLAAPTYGTVTQDRRAHEAIKDATDLHQHHLQAATTSCLAHQQHAAEESLSYRSDVQQMV